MGTEPLVVEHLLTHTLRPRGPVPTYSNINCFLLQGSSSRYGGNTCGYCGFTPGYHRKVRGRGTDTRCSQCQLTRFGLKNGLSTVHGNAPVVVEQKVYRGCASWWAHWWTQCDHAEAHPRLSVANKNLARL